MQAFLDGLTYDENGYSDFLVGTGEDDQTYTLRGREFGGTSHHLYAAIGDGSTTLPLYENGFKSLVDGKFVVGTTITVDTVVDTTPPKWNGVLIGAIE